MTEWAVRLSVITAILAMLTFAIDLPEKLSKITQKNDGRGNKNISQTLSGSIRGEENHPLEGVTVSLLDFKNLESVITDQKGHFTFTVSAPKQDQVALMAQKEGYKIYDGFASLGNTGFEFTMKAEK